MPRPNRKRFGQHFLIDDIVVARLLHLLRPTNAQHIIEIGPGFGVLSTPILDRGCHLTAIEIDRQLAQHLSQSLSLVERFKLIQQDILTVNLMELVPAGQRVRVIGNLPYNISTPLLFHMLDQRSLIEDMHFMLQSEFVDRLVASAGSKLYGRLSVSMQLHCRCERLFYVEPDSFEPAPRVRSAVVRIVPLQEPTNFIADQTLFHDLVRDAFSQRRKTLKNSLGNRVRKSHFSQANIDPGRRAETLSVGEFAALANTISQQ